MKIVGLSLCICLSIGCGDRSRGIDDGLPDGAEMAEGDRDGSTPGPDLARAGDLSSPSSPATVALMASGNATADGTSTILLIATVTSASGDPISGQTVTLTASGSANVLLQPATPTDASGRTSGTLASTKAELKTITAMVGDAVSSSTVVFTAGAPSTATSTFSADPLSIPANGSAASQLTVTLRDAEDNPVLGQAVSLSTGGSPIANGVSNERGVFRAPFTSIQAGTQTVTATAGPLTLTATVTFTASGPGCVGTLMLGGPPLLPVGDYPSSLTSADFNHDGIPDLVVSSDLVVGGSGVDVLLGNGDGTFQSRHRYTTPGWGALSVTTADFDHDGDPDLAVASFSSSQVNVLLGKGDGTFQDQIPYLVGSGPNAVTTADFNNDGNSDLATTSGSDDSLSVLLGKGNGTFEPAQTYHSVGPAPNSVTTADLNHDGNADLVFASFTTSTVGVLFGNGNGTFRDQVSYPSGPTGPSSIAVRTADFNNDGKVDLAVANQNGSTVSVLLGTGNGTFGPQVSYPTSGHPVRITVGDFDSDGKVDVAVVAFHLNNSGGTLDVFLGKGDGAFQGRVSYPSILRPSSVTSADFNGDGRLDLAVTDNNTFGVGSVSIFPGRGDGSFYSRTSYASGTATAGQSPTAVAIGDFNDDGKSDLAVANFDSLTVSVFSGRGDGSFHDQVPLTAGRFPSAVATGDFNGDGESDLAVTNNGDSDSTGMSVLLGKGDGTFQDQIPTPAIDPNDSSVVVGDFNHDSKLDLVVANSDGSTVSVLLGKGDGTFKDQVPYATELGPISIVVGDFDRDGSLDLAVANSSSSSVSVLLNKGDGTFHDQVPYPTGWSPNGLNTADFDGDGKLDLAVANFYDNTVSVLLGKDDGTFHDQISYPTGTFPDTVAAADFSGDGKPDLVIGNGYGGTVSLLVGKGDGSFRDQLLYAAGWDPFSIGAGDFNGDGRPDLAVTDYGTNQVSVLLTECLQ